MKNETVVTDNPLNPFVLSGTSPPGSEKGSDAGIAIKAVAEFLAREAQPCAYKRLMKLVRGRKQHKVAALRRLVHDRQIIRSGTGIKGDPFLYSIPAKSVQSQQSAIVEEIVI